MKRHYSPDQDNLFIIDVGPETAQWKYLSFRVAKLPPGRVLEGNSGSDEIAIVPLHGRARIAFNNNSHELRRDDLFRNGCRHDSDRSVTQRARDHERQPILSAGDHCSSRRI
jgi:5-deoxy-D-glucuronate isomerase